MNVVLLKLELSASAHDYAIFVRQDCSHNFKNEVLFPCKIHNLLNLIIIGLSCTRFEQFMGIFSCFQSFRSEILQQSQHVVTNSYHFPGWDNYCISVLQRYCTGVVYTYLFLYQTLLLLTFWWYTQCQHWLLASFSVYVMTYVGMIHV